MTNGNCTNLPPTELASASGIGIWLAPPDTCSPRCFWSTTLKKETENTIRCLCANSYFGWSEQSYRVVLYKLVISLWRTTTKMLTRASRVTYVLLLCENNTYRAFSLMWTAAVLVYFCFYPRYGVELLQDNTNTAAIALPSIQQYNRHEKTIYDFLQILSFSKI